MMFNSRGEILLVRIGYMHKLWVISGGRLERGEEPVEVAQRELLEETGIAVDTCTHVFDIYHEKQGKKDTVHYFETHSDTNDFVIDGEEITDAG